MYGSGYIFSRAFFTAWIVISIIWVWGTMLVAGFYPIIDGREQIIQVWRGLRGGLNKGGEAAVTAKTSTRTTTPVESGNASSEEKSVK